MALAGDVFGPAVAALTLGLFPTRGHWLCGWGAIPPPTYAGNVVIALIAGAVGYVFSQRAVFLLAPVFALPGLRARR